MESDLAVLCDRCWDVCTCDHAFTQLDSIVRSLKKKLKKKKLKLLEPKVISYCPYWHTFSRISSWFTPDKNKIELISSLLYNASKKVIYSFFLPYSFQTSYKQTSTNLSRFLYLHSHISVDRTRRFRLKNVRNAIKRRKKLLIRFYACLSSQSIHRQCRHDSTIQTLTQ